MKRYLSIIARVLLAVLGLLYVAYSLNWHDYIELPVGHALNTTDTPLNLDVIALSDAGYTVEPPPGSTASGLAFAREELGSAERGEPELHESVVTMLANANWTLLLLGLGLVGPIYSIQAYRWLVLMRCRELDVTYARCFKLNMVGTFFNLCMPGTTGGDVIKAYYAAKRSDRRGAAVMSVIFDRVTGLLGLVIVAGVASLFIYRDPFGHQVAVYVWIVLGATVVGSALYFSRRLHKLIGLEYLTSKLKPESVLARVESTARAYSAHKLAVTWSVLLSLPVHVMLAGAGAVAGYALGVETGLIFLLTVIPLLLLAGSAPLTLQGLGVMEFLAFKMLLPTGTATANQVVGMLLLLRLYMVFYGLLGSIYLLGGDIHLHEAEAAAPPTEDAEQATA